MNARAAALFADSSDHADWAWAGDQLYVDLDLSTENLPTGARIAVGDAVLEVTAEPHLGCGKFSRRFGVDALKVVNSATGRAMRLRGVNTRVVSPGAGRRRRRGPQAPLRRVRSAAQRRIRRPSYFSSARRRRETAR